MATERRPSILAVDDEPAVLAAVSRDLRRGFGDQYRILRASSGQEGLDLIRQARRRGDQIALIVADQRMPEMTGTEFLTETRKLVPNAGRVLLTAYADTDAAIASINVVNLDHYLTKPWDPPETNLFPPIRDLLLAWQSGAALESDDVRVVGHRFSKDSHALRDFLARNRVPARWYDIERDEEGRELLDAAGLADDCLPAVFLKDGEVMERPDVITLAGKLGVAAAPQGDHYDLVIVGGGPAGLAAAVYGSSEGLRTMMIEREAPGGQAGQSSRIENYLGFPNGVSGGDLAKRASDQARRLGAEMLTVRNVTALRADGTGRFLTLDDEQEISANCVIISSGVDYRQLDAPGFEEFTGAGIYYGAAPAEARSCENQNITIIGAGNSAGQSAVFISGFATKVTMLVRGPSLESSMSQYLIEQIAEKDNIDVRFQSSAVAARGDGHLEEFDVKDGDGNIEVLPADACFVFIGAMPGTKWLEGTVAMDERGFIRAGTDVGDAWQLDRDPLPLETSIPGVFVAGDVRSRSIKRVASAVGEGSMAVSLIHQYLADS